VPDEDVPGRRARPSWRSTVAAGAIGALVASAVTAGAFAVLDDDAPTSAPTSPLVTAASFEGDPAEQTDASGLRAVLDAVRPAVVRIAVDTGFGQGEGTGFIVSNDGVIVTNAHVAADADEIRVTLADGDEEQATLLGADPQHDLAVIKVARTGLPTVRIGDSDPPATQVGDPVIAIGNALGLEGDLSVTTGIVSALDRQLEIDARTVLVSVIQTDAAINPGNSGGPLVNRRGEVIGINTAIAPPEESNNVGFAISISSAKPIIEALRAGRDPQIAFLGVESEDVTPQLAEREDIVADAGAYITQVVVGSPADSAGLQDGDVVVELGGRPIDGRASLLRTIRRNEPGDEVEVVIERDGENETLEIVLGTLPEDNV
jgi:S1-C subfamily serine protease